ncbi:MAG TPA: T9SS type A sorting domain-containing protein, partial [Ignavibacteria bacterium]|nr:T9SS type A sorting domain-containing protein [Ignavibacteria bacterium]
VRVRGTVSETNGMTRLIIATPGDIQNLGAGTIPPFEVLTPAVLADNKIDGDTTAEKWESVLVRYSNQCVISCVNAPSASGCTSDNPLPDTSFRRNFGEILVVYPGENVESRIELQDGNHTKTNGWDPAGPNYYTGGAVGTLFRKWDGISSLQGVLYYAFGKYKIVPRTNNDFGTVIGVNPISEIATQFWLKQNYPNPFNPVTNIVYNLPVEAEVSVKIFNLLGQEVKTLVSGIQNKGKYEVKFDGMDLASGMYIYVLEANTFEGNSFRDVKKMVLVK